MEQRLTEDAASPKSGVPLKEIFNKAFPSYLAMGMTSAEFWEQDPALVLAYRKAHWLRFQEQNRMAWLQGRYIYDAVCAASPLFHDFAKRGTKAAPYYEAPIKFYENEAERIEAEKEKLRQETIRYFTRLITGGG
ncbi:MAG: hypothetical protein NC299_11985 [Lachnospiraceae bacterium]|nr:hypothetical protein [Lachnospiraceae bacterium]